MILPHHPPTIHRLRVAPDEPVAPDAIPPHRGKGLGRPHSDAKVAEVRRLIEQTPLSLAQIAARAGISQSCVRNWLHNGGWQRHPFAPGASDRVSDARAGQKLKLRRLAERLRLLAERNIRELEDSPAVDVDRLVQALEVLKMARIEAMCRKGSRRLIGPAASGGWMQARDAAIRTALREMRRGGVDLDRAPQEAMDLVIAAHTPVEDPSALHPKGRRRGRRR